MSIEQRENADYLKLKAENREKISEYIVGSKDGKADFYPRYIQIEQTNKCNARCIMCNHFYLANNGASDISDDVMEQIVNVLPFCETVMLNGDGEPFLSSNIVENIKTMSKYGVEIGTNTNLSYVPGELWFYLQNNFKFLNISCDAATRKTYELIRRGLSYDYFISNLEKLERTAPGLKKNLDCVVMKQNILELPQIVKLASDYGIANVKFHRLGINPCIGNQDDEAEYYYALLDEKMKIAIELGKKLKVNVGFPDFQRKQNTDKLLDEEMFEFEVEKRYEQARSLYGGLSLETDYYSELATMEQIKKQQWCSEKICQWAIERCYVDLKGNVTTCCFNMKKYMGNLLENSFDEIWNGETYRELRKMMAELKLPDFCRQCNWIKESKF